MIGYSTTLALVAIFRVGSAIVVPGVVKDALAKSMNAGSNDLLGLINNFSGGAFSQAAVFALGVMPIYYSINYCSNIGFRGSVLPTTSNQRW